MQAGEGVQKAHWNPWQTCHTGQAIGYDGLHLGVVLDGFVTVLGVLVMILRKTMC
jgi:hypothetical protein